MLNCPLQASLSADPEGMQSHEYVSIPLHSHSPLVTSITFSFHSLAPPRSYGQTLERKLSEPILSSIGRGEEGQDLLVTHSLCADLDKGSTHSLRERKVRKGQYLI